MRRMLAVYDLYFTVGQGSSKYFVLPTGAGVTSGSTDRPISAIGQLSRLDLI